MITDRINLVLRAHVSFGQRQDTKLRVSALTKRHVGSGNEIETELDDPKFYYQLIVKTAISEKRLAKL